MIRDSGSAMRQVMRTLAVGLLLLPFIVTRAFAPGTMPGGDHGMQVVLCTDSGLQTVVIGRDGVPRPVQDQPSDHSDPCAWASATHVVVALDAPALPAPRTMARQLASEARGALPLRAALAPVPPARAPPTSV